MRVGIHLTGTIPREGGGHTFEHGVFNAALDRMGSSTHDFVVFGESPEPPAGLASAGVPFVSLHRERATRFGDKVGVAAERFWRSLRHPSLPFDRGERDRSVRAALSRTPVDLIWSLSPTFLSLDVPFITTQWDMEHRVQPYFPEVSADRVWSRREAHFSALLRRATYVLAGTRTGADEIRRAYGVAGDRIRVLPLPTPRFALDAASAAASPEERPGRQFILYPAQFWPHKNHVALLHALRILRDEMNEPLRAVFVGADHGNREYVERVCESLGLREQVDFRGFVPIEELIHLYRTATALVNVSLFGPDNLPPLEAFALGCPVIAAGNRGAEEQLGSAALLIDGLDDRAIAHAIARVRSDPRLREEMTAAGHLRAQAWTPIHYVDAVLDLVDEFALIRRCWD